MSRPYPVQDLLRVHEPGIEPRISVSTYVGRTPSRNDTLLPQKNNCPPTYARGLATAVSSWYLKSKYVLLLSNISENYCCWSNIAQYSFHMGAGFNLANLHEN